MDPPPSDGRLSRADRHVALFPGGVGGPSSAAGVGGSRRRNAAPFGAAV